MRATLGSIYQRTKKRVDGSVRTLPIWWIKYRAKGQVFRESSGSEKYVDAKRLLKRRLGEIATGQFAGLGPERVRFSDLAAGVITDYLENGRSSIAHVERRLRLHLLPAFGTIRAADFGTNHVRRYIEQRRREGATNATINRELAIVKRAFRLVAESDPPMVTRIPGVPTLEENKFRTGFLEHEAYLRVRTELPEEIRPLLVIAYYTGARLGELKSLRWSQVDLSANRITLYPGTTKNGEGKSLPIYGEMSTWLTIEKEIRDTRFPGCAHVFRRSGKPIKDFRKAWAEASKRAGVPGLLFHDLRRSAVRNVVRAGVPEKIAMQISGHKTRSVFDRYNIVSDRDLDLAAERMQRHLESLGTLSGTPSENRVDFKEDTKRASLLQ